MSDFWKVQRPWNEKRLKAIVNYYGAEFFDGIKVLDLGCGHGFFGDELTKLGAKVTYCDARIKHLIEIKERNPDADTRLVDLEFDFPRGEWDLTIHFGVLYHLENVEANLLRACLSTEHMILEVVVCDSKDPYLCDIRNEDETNISQAFRGVGSRPTPAFIERNLKENGMQFIMLTTTECDDHIHTYSWEAKNRGKNTSGQRRMWFIRRDK